MTAARRPGRFTRVRVLLAGGLVLGAGATATTASWVDNEFAAGTMRSSVFGTQSSVDAGATWANSPDAPGASLKVAATLAPGDATAAAVGIRAVQASTDGSVAVAAPTPTPASPPALWGALQYRLYRSASSTCTAASSPAAPSGWIAGNATTWAALSDVVPTNSTPLAAGTPGAPGAASWFCVQLRLPADAPSAVQGQSVQATWRFTGASS